ncbi:MAG: dTDP-4-dehydrorhamnose reductase [Rhizobiaceae bacterium]|nr:dTDP-4-dehydrorhamnose reductase [Rhizobiaceae bacterium]
MMAKQDVLVVGENGQLATALKQKETIAGHRIISLGRPAMDLAHAETIEQAIGEHNPALVINAAAYTAVDKAESEADMAKAVNADGVGRLGQICARHDIPVIHISTDYVFDGKAKKPYAPGDKTAPQGVYGRSKEQGETELRAANEQHLIFRTAWVFGEHGNNFLKTMLRLGRTNNQIRVVDDQFGTPTYTGDLATGLSKIAAQVLSRPNDISWGTYHLTNSGETTWCGFAREIFECSATENTPSPQIIGIPTEEYPTPAARPAYSILDCTKTKKEFGVDLPDWKDATMRCIKNIEGTAS